MRNFASSPPSGRKKGWRICIGTPADYSEFSIITMNGVKGSFTYYTKLRGGLRGIAFLLYCFIWGKVVEYLLYNKNRFFVEKKVILKYHLPEERAKKVVKISTGGGEICYLVKGGQVKITII